MYVVKCCVIICIFEKFENHQLALACHHNTLFRDHYSSFTLNYSQKERIEMVTLYRHCILESRT